jgi:hypothetical protein
MIRYFKSLVWIWAVFGICCFSPEPQARQRWVSGVEIGFQYRHASIKTDSPFHVGDWLEKQSERTEFALGLEGSWWDFFWRYRISAVRTADEWSDEAVLRELSRTFDLSPSVQLLIGKRILSWSVGYAFTPLGFFQAETDFFDITDTYGSSEGLPLIALALYRTDWDLSVVYSDDVGQEADGFNRGRRQWGAKVHWMIDQGSFSLILQQPEPQPPGFGFSFTATGPKGLGFHGSAFTRRGTRRPIHQSILLKQLQFDLEDPYGDHRIDENRWYPRGVLGLSSMDGQLVDITLEAIYDSRGLSADQWHHFNQLIDYHRNDAPVWLPSEVRDLNLGYDAQTLNSYRSRQHYLFLRIGKTLESITISQSFLIGTDDSSGISRSTIQYASDQDWGIELTGSHYWGAPGTESDLTPWQNTVFLGTTRRF